MFIRARKVKNIFNQAGGMPSTPEFDHPLSTSGTPCQQSWHSCRLAVGEETANSQTTSMRRIAIIDADHIASCGWRRRFERHGYAVHLASAAEDVLEMDEVGRPDLIILHLPAIGDDNRAIGMLLGCYPSIPIIGVMAGMTAERAAHAIACGVMEVVAKPIEPIHLLPSPDRSWAGLALASR